MLFIALILVATLYVVLYFAWVAASPYVNQSSTTLMLLRDLLFGLPALAPLAILKWAIIIMAFYLIADTLLSSTRWRRKSK